MSTKSTIACGDNFHLYHECFDDTRVYLQLEGCPFEVSFDATGTATVAIPIEIWEVLRHFPALDYTYADLSDDDIDAVVRDWVAKRPTTGIGRLFGAGVYGSPDDPADVQIARGVEHYRRKRADQRAVRDFVRHGTTQSGETGGTAQAPDAC